MPYLLSNAPLAWVTPLFQESYTLAFAFTAVTNIDGDSDEVADYRCNMTTEDCYYVYTSPLSPPSNPIEYEHNTAEAVLDTLLCEQGTVILGYQYAPLQHPLAECVYLTAHYADKDNYITKALQISKRSLIMDIYDGTAMTQYFSKLGDSIMVISSVPIFTLVEDAVLLNAHEIIVPALISISLDLSVFRHPAQLSTALRDSKGSVAGTTHASMLMCYSIAAALDGTDFSDISSAAPSRIKLRSFMLSSGHRASYQILQYWMDYCGLYPMMVHMRSLARIRGRRLDDCTIDRVYWSEPAQSDYLNVSGLDDYMSPSFRSSHDINWLGRSTTNRSNKKKTKSRNEEIYCVPDVINKLSSIARTPDNGRKGNVVNYVVGAGLIPLTISLAKSGMLHDGLMDTPEGYPGLSLPRSSRLGATELGLTYPAEEDISWTELMIVLQSLQFADRPLHLLVSVAWKDMVRALQLEREEVSDAAACFDASQWQSLISEITTALTHFKTYDDDRSGFGDKSGRHRVLPILHLYSTFFRFLHSVTAATVTGAQQPCEIPVTVGNVLKMVITFASQRELIPRSFLYRYFCIRRIMNKIVLALHKIQTNVSDHLSQSGTNDTDTNNRDIGSGRLHEHFSEESVSQRLYPLTNHAYYPFVPVHVGEAEAHVLVFVGKDQVPAAQLQIQKWKENCAIPICQIFMRYSLHVVPLGKKVKEKLRLQRGEPGGKSGKPYSNLCHSNKAQQESDCTSVLYSTQPSLRLALLHTSHWIESFCGPKDVVFMLVGMQALRIFPQPGIWANTTDRKKYKGIIPLLAYSDNRPYRLKTPLQVHALRDHSSNGFDYDFNAVVGTAFAWKILMNSIKLDPDYYMSAGPVSDAGTIETLKRFADNNPHFMGVDGNNDEHVHAFDDAEYVGNDSRPGSVVGTSTTDLCLLRPDFLARLYSLSYGSNASLIPHISHVSAEAPSIDADAASGRKDGTCVYVDTVQHVFLYSATVDPTKAAGIPELKPVNSTTSSSTKQFNTRQSIEGMSLEDIIAADSVKKALPSNAATEKMQQPVVGISIIHESRPEIDVVAAHANFSLFQRSLARLLSDITTSKVRSMIDFDAGVLEVLVHQINRDWNHAQWHLVVANKFLLFKYIHEVIGQMSQHMSAKDSGDEDTGVVDAIMPQLRLNDYMFMHYYYAVLYDLFI
jgi:hypothetical protein